MYMIYQQSETTQINESGLVSGLGSGEVRVNLCKFISYEERSKPQSPRSKYVQSVLQKIKWNSLMKSFTFICTGQYVHKVLFVAYFMYICTYVHLYHLSSVICSCTRTYNEFKIQ